MKDEPVNLGVRTKSFALRIIKMYAALPRTTEAQVLGKQVLRSGTSVGANYREAYRARSMAEFVAKMGGCVKELEETAYWLDLLTGARIVSEQSLSALKEENNELISIFVTIIKQKRSDK
jgi:four helix bundle protein